MAGGAPNGGLNSKASSTGGGTRLRRLAAELSSRVSMPETPSRGLLSVSSSPSNFPPPNTSVVSNPSTGVDVDGLRGCSAVSCTFAIDSRSSPISDRRGTATSSASSSGSGAFGVVSVELRACHGGATRAISTVLTSAMLGVGLAGVGTGAAAASAAARVAASSTSLSWAWMSSLRGSASSTRWYQAPAAEYSARSRAMSPSSRNAIRFSGSSASAAVNTFSASSCSLFSKSA